MGKCLSKRQNEDERKSETRIENITAEVVKMSKSSSKPDKYEDISQEEKVKLNALFEELVTKAGVDFSNPEIQDIQIAVTEMVDRIKTWMNERGDLRITKIVPCGSMAEKTAMWKYGYFSEELFIEFDFLAVLQAAADIKASCQECFRLNELHKEYYRNSYYRTYKFTGEKTFDEVFTEETNNCLTSCGCLNVKYPERDKRIYTFVPSSTCSKTLQGCDKCTVDRPTGTLRVKTSAEIGRNLLDQCSLKFDWTSKAKTLCTRDKWCLTENEKMDNLTIHIDFLPALEVFQSKQQSDDVAARSSPGLVLKPTSSEYEHYCFMVPKYCAVCDRKKMKDTWRRSGCRAEIDTVKKMTDKHRKCYQVLKHLTGVSNNYHLKIGVLHHNDSCSDASEDYAKCVFNLLDELQHAYETRQLKSFHSQANLLEQERSDYCDLYSKDISSVKEIICSAGSKSDSVSSFLKEVSDYVFPKYRP